MEELPFELLSSIFITSVKQLHVAPETLCALCSRLRSVALNTPKLWTNIYWEPTASENNKGLHYLKRSAKALIELEMSFIDSFFDQPALMKETSKHFQNHVTRISSLAIFQSTTHQEADTWQKCLPRVHEFLLTLECEAPALRKLEMDIVLSSSTPRHLSPMFLGSIQNQLECLSFHDVFLPNQDYAAFTALRTVQLVVPYFPLNESTIENRRPYCLLACASLPSLTELKVDDSGSSWLWPLAEEPSVVFNSLKQLELRSDHFPLLSYIRCPLLEAALLDAGNALKAMTAVSVDQFLKRHCATIRHLALPDVYDASDEESVGPYVLPNLTTYQGYHENLSGGVVLKAIHGHALRKVTLLQDQLDVFDLASFLRSASATLEFIEIHPHMLGPYGDIREPGYGSTQIAELDFPALREYIARCQIGDIIFERIVSAPLLGVLHLNGEPDPRDHQMWIDVDWDPKLNLPSLHTLLVEEFSQTINRIEAPSLRTVVFGSENDGENIHFEWNTSVFGTGTREGRQKRQMSRLILEFLIAHAESLETIKLCSPLEPTSSFKTTHSFPNLRHLAISSADRSDDVIETPNLESLEILHPGASDVDLRDDRPNYGFAKNITVSLVHIDVLPDFGSMFRSVETLHIRIFSYELNDHIYNLIEFLDSLEDTPIIFPLLKKLILVFVGSFQRAGLRNWLNEPSMSQEISANGSEDVDEKGFQNSDDEMEGVSEDDEYRPDPDEGDDWESGDDASDDCISDHKIFASRGGGRKSGSFRDAIFEQAKAQSERARWKTFDEGYGELLKAIASMVSARKRMGERYALDEVLIVREKACEQELVIPDDLKGTIAFWDRSIWS